LGYKLPKSLRKSLHKPIGELFTGKPVEAAKKAIRYILEKNPTISISVGDYCTKALIEANYFPNIVIYDGKTLRTEQISLNLSTYSEKRIFNPRGWISIEAWEVIESVVLSFSQKDTKRTNNCRVCVHITGEEDLLVIPAIIVSPLKSIVVYGQPPLNTEFGTTKEGIVAVIITSQLKKRVQDLFTKFEIHEEITNGNHNSI
jgi:uncharacterized protein (UPF0218 family)